MSTASRRRYIREALGDIRAAGTGLADAERSIEEQSTGIRAACYDPSSRPAIVDDIDREFGPALISDPTGNAAGRVDAARAANRRLDRAAEALAKAAAELRACVTQSIARATPTAEELADLEAKAEPGCEVVSRIQRGEGLPPYWEPIDRTSDFGGLLPRPYALGAWAATFVRRNGRLPTTHEAQAHCENRRVMVKA